MRTKIYFFTLFIFCLTKSEAQNAKLNYQWRFGHNSGVSFSSGSPVSVSGSMTNANEGNSTIADSLGNLLFYVDDKAGYNKNNTMMPNNPGALTNTNSAQGLLITPFPANPQKYFVFGTANWGWLGTTFYYFVVDMSLQGGLGDFTGPNYVHRDSLSNEQLAATWHANGRDIWVLTHQRGNQNFQAWLVTPTGVSTTPVVSSVAMTYSGSNRYGSLRFSHYCNHIVSALGGGGPETVQLLDFDNSTGVVSNPVTLGTSTTIPGAYSAEFSPDDSKLYVTSYNGNFVYQFDLSNANPVSTLTNIASTGAGTKSSVLLGPDQKIYVNISGGNYLDVINSPNSLGAACNYSTNAVTLSGTCGLGLPNFLSTSLPCNPTVSNGCTTVVLQPDSANGKDAMVNNWPSYVNTNMGSTAEFDATGWTCQSIVCNLRSLIEFDLSSIPANATIQSAFLTLYENPTNSNGLQNGQHSQLSGPNDAYLERINQPWNEFTVTWNNQPTTTTLNRAYLPPSTNGYQNYTIDMKQLIIDTRNNPGSSFGFMLRLVTEQYYRALLFASSDHPNAALHPKLEITYCQCTSIVLQPDSAKGKDAYLLSAPLYANNNSGSSHEFTAGAWTFSGVPGNVRSVVAFDLSVIPPGATINSAKLSLYHQDSLTGAGQHSTLSGPNDAWLERITQPWGEYTTAWNNQPATTTQNRVALAASTSLHQDYPNIDVTNLVTDMVNNPSSSFGFMFKLQNESFYRSMNFCSSDHPDSTMRPKLEICYSVTGAPPTAHFFSSDTSFCNEGGNCISFYDQSTNNPTGWKWSFPGATPDTSSQQNPTNICYYTPGTYPVTLITWNSSGSDTLTISPLITFGSAPPPPTLTVSHDTIFCSPPYPNYQWYLNGSPVFGATNSYVVATQSGVYSVYITDAFGCGRLSAGVTYTASVCQHIVLLNQTAPEFCFPVDSTHQACTYIIDSVCAKSCMTINASVAGGTAPYTFLWTPHPGVTVSPSTGNTSLVCITDTFPAYEAFDIQIADAAGCFTTVSCTLQTQICTGIPENLIFGQSLLIFPNPSNGQFTVSGSQFIREGTIDVYNVLGEIVYTEAFNGKEKMVDAKLNPGIYFVRVSDEKNNLIQKIIVE